MNWTVIRLAIGVFWLFLGGAILVWEGQQGKPLIGHLPFSTGWLAIFIAVYNFLRAFTSWLMDRQRRRAKEPERPKPMETTQPDKPVVNPTFQFDKPVSPPETK